MTDRQKASDKRRNRRVAIVDFLKWKELGLSPVMGEHRRLYSTKDQNPSVCLLNRRLCRPCLVAFTSIFDDRREKWTVLPYHAPWLVLLGDFLSAAPYIRCLRCSWSVVRSAWSRVPLCAVTQISPSLKITLSPATLHHLLT